jgi:methionine-gamma-lyase
MKNQHLLQQKITEKAKTSEVMPIYHSTAYTVKDTDDYDLAGQGEKYFYSRTANPNRDELSGLINTLENGEDTLICSSGMAAISTTLISLLKQGDHILFNRHIYGETISIAQEILDNFGIESTFVDFTDIGQVKNALKKNTKLLYAEIIANPLTQVIDLNEIVKLAHDNHSLVAIDSTFTTPFAIKPLNFGVDIVIHSLTKYFGGHSDITGGSITANQQIIDKILPKYVLLGCCMDPNTAWLTCRSIKTMEMRVEKQFNNAKSLAEYLEHHTAVRCVYHPSLSSHPQHQLATDILNEHYGAILSFRVTDDRQKVNAFIGKLNQINYLGTLGGVITSLAHPASAFRHTFPPEKLQEMGLHEGLIRISVGIENSKDLIADIEQALQCFE